MKSRIQTPFTHRQYMLSQDFETRHNNVDLHSHDYYEFYFYMEGDVEFEIGDRRQALRSGDFVIVPPETMHRAFVVNTELPYRRFVFWIGTDFAQQLAEHFPDFAFLLNYMRRERHHNIFHNDPVSFNAILSKALQLLEEVHGNHFAREAVIEIRVEDAHPLRGFDAGFGLVAKFATVIEVVASATVGAVVGELSHEADRTVVETPHAVGDETVGTEVHLGGHGFKVGAGIVSGAVVGRGRNASVGSELSGFSGSFFAKSHRLVAHFDEVALVVLNPKVLLGKARHSYCEDER